MDRNSRTPKQEKPLPAMCGKDQYLGKKWILPLGDHWIMDHYSQGMVYISGFYGEPQYVFVKALHQLDIAISMGVKVNRIKVTAVCKAEFWGTYKQLKKIVDAICKHDKTQPWSEK